MSEPLAPDMPSNADIRNRRAQAMRQMTENGVVNRTNGTPASIDFEVHEVPRADVQQSTDAQAFLATSNDQGRIFAQALSEAFGGVDSCISLSIDIAPRADFNQIAGDDGKIMMVTVHREDRTDHTFYLNADTIADIHPIERRPLFRATETAQNLTHYYRIYYPD